MSEQNKAHHPEAPEKIFITNDAFDFHGEFSQIEPEGEIFDTYIRADLVQAQLAQAREQLPEGMEHCTIRFIECEKGHGRRTATNWVQHGCIQCELQQAREQNAKLLSALKDARDSLEIIGMPDELEDLNVAAIDAIIAEAEQPPSNPAERDV